MVETAEMLSRLDSMEPAAAAADAAEIRRIALAAQRVAERLASAFGPSVLTGVSASAANASGADIARQVESVAGGLEQGHLSLSDAAATLGATVAFRPQIAALDALTTAPPAVLTAVRTALGGELTGTYNAPMAATAVAATPVSADYTDRGATTATTAATPPPATQNAAGVTDAATGQPGSITADGPLPVDSGAPTAGEQPAAPTGPTGTAPTSAVGPDAAGPAAATGPRAPLSAPSPSGPGSSPSGPPGPAATTVPAGVPLAVTPGMRMVGTAIPEALRPGAARSGAANLGRPTGLRPSMPTGGLAGSSTASNATSGAAANSPTTTAGTQQGPGARTGQAPYGAAPTARRSSDEPGHRPADYLRSTSEGQLVLGPAPIVGPPVIGVLATAEPTADATDADVVENNEDDDDQILDLTL